MSTPMPGENAERILSELLVEDPDMRDLVEDFVGILDQRVDELKQAYEAADWAQLTQLAHQLKGAGGSYGYPNLSSMAADMEQEFRAQTGEQFSDWVRQLEQFVAGARAGLADD